MKLGIFAKTFKGNEPTDVLQSAKNAGYSCVQYNWACAGLPSMPDQIPDRAIQATREAVVSTGLSIVALSGTYNMIHPDPAVRTDGLRRLDAVLHSASELNIPVVTLCTGSRNAHDQWSAHPDNNSRSAWQDLLHGMEQALLMAEAVNVKLGVEPELTNTINNIDKALDLMHTFNSAHLCIVLDPANLFEVAPDTERRQIIEAAIDKLAPYIKICHAKDRLADGKFATVGRGVIDFNHYLGHLKAVSFQGPLIAHGLGSHEAATVARFLRHSL